MSVTEYYIDVVSGTDMMGNGSTTFPYATLSHALSTHGAVTNGVRYNIKGTTSGSPHTSTGSLPAASSTKPLYIAPYTTTAGDSAGPVYLSGGGSIIYDQNTRDNIHFINCHFSNCGDQAFNLDNFCNAINCTFDGCGATADSRMRFFNCHFKNISGIPLNDANNHHWFYNTVEYSGDYSGYIMQGETFIGNRVKMSSGSVNAVMFQSYANNNVAIGNSLYCTTGSNDDDGMRLATNSICQHNYIEGATVGINKYGRGSLVANNRFYNCSTNVSTRSTSIEIQDSTTGTNNSSLSASGLPDIGSVDFTPSTELRDSTTLLTSDLPGLTTGMNQQFGGVLDVPSGGGGSTHTPRLRVIQ